MGIELLKIKMYREKLGCLKKKNRKLVSFKRAIRIFKSF